MAQANDSEFLKVGAAPILWDALTTGLWANYDSPGMPRVSRILLYFGYLLFSIAVLNWSVATHDTAPSPWRSRPWTVK